ERRAPGAGDVLVRSNRNEVRQCRDLAAGPRLRLIDVLVQVVVVTGACRQAEAGGCGEYELRYCAELFHREGVSSSTYLYVLAVAVIVSSSNESFETGAI